MTEEQIEVINVVQEVLRGVVISALALNRTEAQRFAGALQANAVGPAISPMAERMLLDLAAGVAQIEGAGRARQ